MAATDEIPGWFDFRPVYERAAAEAPPGAVLVEVGVFCGKSLAFLAERRGGDCRVVGVDTFLGSPEFVYDGRSGLGVRKADGTPFQEWPVGLIAQECIAGLYAKGLLGRVQLVVSDSVRAAGLFADGSVWMVMLDGAHDRASVAADIAAWWPKVAPGGLLCGDDYRPEFPGVVAAVDAAFPGREVVGGTAWAVRKGVAA